MTNATSIKRLALSSINTGGIKWTHFEADPKFDYPIDYQIGILGSAPDGSSVDFLGKWAPNSYCHYHRHLGDTTSLILEGEHHTIEMTDSGDIHKIRQPGDYARKPGGDLHMEYAGPEGSLVFFSMQVVDGQIFEVLGRGEKVLAVPTFEDFIAGHLGR